MKINKIFSLAIFIILAVEGFVFVTYAGLFPHSNAAAPITQMVAVKSVNTTITAEGIITAQNQATLHFQTAGKLIALPVKEGDQVTEGKVIAQLDSYALQKQLTQALNTYRATRNTFDQTKDNQTGNVIQNQQKTTVNAAGGYNGGEINSYLNDVAKRIVDNNQATLDNSVITVELANYALDLSRLTSPLNGIVTHEDVLVSGVNITPLTSFTVADPSTTVFRANIAESDIDYVSQGARATISLDGNTTKISGTVVKIYPSKVTLSNGQQVYQVDIQSDDLKTPGKFDQTGTVLIDSSAGKNLTLVPAWTVLSGKYIWVDGNGIPTIKMITVGKTHGNEIEILSGLTPNDKIIVDPQYILDKMYKIL